MAARKQTPKPLTVSETPIVDKTEELPELAQGIRDDAAGTIDFDEKSMEAAACKEPLQTTEWVKIDRLSDNEMEVEAINIDGGFQLRQVWLRVRVGGQLTGQIINLDKTQFNETKQTFSRR